MKTCSYCGREYPDDVPACVVDQTPLDAGISEKDPAIQSASDNSGRNARTIWTILIIVAVTLADFALPFACGFFNLNNVFFILSFLVLLLAPFLAGTAVILITRKVSWVARLLLGMVTCAILLGSVLWTPLMAVSRLVGFEANFLLTKNPARVQRWAVGVLDAYDHGTLGTTTNVEHWGVATEKLYDDEIPPFIENLWWDEPSIGIAAMTTTGDRVDLSGSNSMNFAAFSSGSLSRTHCVAFSWHLTGILVGRPDFRPTWNPWYIDKIGPGIYVYYGH